MDYADDAAKAARSFQHLSSQQFGDRFLSDLDTAAPDAERYRRDALGGVGMSGSSWALGTSTMQRPSTYCFPGGSAGGTACVQLRNGLESTKVMNALAATFGQLGPGGAAQAKVVDAEVAAAIQADAGQGRVNSLQKVRVRELLRQCNSAANVTSTRDAKRLAEECRAAAEQAQVLHLEEGQEMNVKLAQIARLQAVGVEQKNADLKRELAELAARRTALTAGLEDLAGQRPSIRSGGLGP